MRSFRNFLSFVDLFRRPILLYSEENKFRSTTTGIFFSLFIYGLLISMFFTSNMILKKSPQITDQPMENKSRPEIVINSPIIFDICDENSVSFYDPTIFTINASILELTTNENTRNGKKVIREDKKIMRICKEEDFPPGVYKEMGFSNKFCMENKTIQMKGFWDEKDLTYTYIWISRCVNGTSDTVCKSHEEIDKFFKHKYMNIFLTNPYIDMSDYDQPLKYLWKNEFQYIDPSMKKNFGIYLKKVEFIDDKGWYHSSPEQIQTYSFDRRETDSLIEYQSNILFEINFYSSIIFQKKVRLYQKLLDVLANMGGIASILMILGYIITYPQFILLSIQSTMSYLFILYKEGISKDLPEKKASLQFIEGDSDRAIKIAEEKLPNEKNINVDIKKRKRGTVGFIKTNAEEKEEDCCNSEKSVPVINTLSALKIDIVESKSPSPRKDQNTVGLKFSDKIAAIKRESLTEKRRKSLINFENKVAFNLFSLLEYFKYYIKKFMKVKFSEREKNFFKVEEQFQKEVNVANMLGRLLILEKLMEKLSKSVKKNNPKRLLRNYSATCLVHDT